jgi:hypothetical protein
MTARYCLLDGVACIAVHGADAQSYLQAQLSQDVAALDATRAPLAGWHDPRGRVRALFRVLRWPERWVLLTPRDLLGGVLSGLRQYVLRAAVVLEPADDLAAAAVVDGDEWLASRGLAPAAPDSAVEQDGLRWVRQGAGLTQVVGLRSRLAILAAELQNAPADVAAVGEIRLGLPQVTSATADRFVAQMLNLDLLNAIAYNKGCYPGQEIIARVRNLGSVKRRMRRYSASGSALPAAGAEVFAADGTAVGEVVRAARSARRVELLAVVEHEFADRKLSVAPDLHLTREALPYEVPAR